MSAHHDYMSMSHTERCEPCRLRYDDAMQMRATLDRYRAALEKIAGNKCRSMWSKGRGYHSEWVDVARAALADDWDDAMAAIESLESLRP